MAEFVILRNGILETYDNYDDIPEEFDNVIRFIPDFPEGPHTHDEHEEMSFWNQKLQELIKREKNASCNKNR
jgi:hypothetical protein